MLEADYCGMLIYLWGKAQELHRPNKQEVHIDKIANATIHLPVSFLVEPVDKQLAFFSQHAVSDFTRLDSKELSEGEA